jgi:hypothetical protein
MLRTISLIFLAPSLCVHAQEKIEFNRDVRPILSDTCFQCHGPDKAKLKAKLRLDVESRARPALDEVLKRISSTDPDEQMPPPNFGRQLKPEQIDTLKRWVAQGAPWQAHWSFIPPKRPALPMVKNVDWPRNAVDFFVLAKLEQNGLAPSKEADDETLRRRVSLDLTGLPPCGPSHYESLVDALLASPRYGERMAIRWLDAARYADTSGYQSDGERWMWRWRDWVIDAFNTNMPFNQFTIEQIAGDLLPNATLSQKLATGFNRNHRGNAEGGIVPEEYAVEYVVDRVDTTCTVWLGLTMGCARCHDHKYDPLSQREFYQIFAYFNNVPEKGKAIKIGNSVPWMQAPTPAQQRELARLDYEVAAAEKTLTALEPRIVKAQRLHKKYQDTESWTITRGLRYRLEKRETFDGVKFIEGGDVGAFGFFDRFSLTASVTPIEGKNGAIMSRMVESQDDSAFASIDEGWRVFLKDGRVQLHLTKRWLDDALRVETEEKLLPGRAQHITVIYDGSRVAAGVRIFIDGKPQKLRVLLDMLNQTFLTPQPFRIGAGGGPANRFRGQIGDVRIYNRVLSEEEVKVIAMPNGPEASRAWFLDKYAQPELREAKNRLVSLREQRTAFFESLPTVMIMEEMPVSRPTHILLRGEYDKPGERVSPGVPLILGRLPAGAPKNRLGFAQWLVSEKNPLTARVAVNQMWQMVFGTGLVKTAEDFGSQGEPPSHPELLDWLATELMRTNWDVKRMMRLLVTSTTYRQSSAVSKHTEADPDNRLLSRAPRLRLSAEMVRDQALAAAGLLVESTGGPSVKPYQPPGLGKELNGTDLELDHGDKLFRRSLYTFWKRTSPQPTMTAFDAPGREMCSVRPTRTNTPLQALALMNDVTFVEASRGIAQRIMHDSKTPEQRVSHAFRLVLAREPKADELRLLLANWQDQLARFRSDPAAAKAFISAGESPRDEKLPAAEHAAYAALCALIMNLDEAITRP